MTTVHPDHDTGATIEAATGPRPKMTDPADLVTFLRDRYDDAVRAAEGTGTVAWLTYREPDGTMRYTTVASRAGGETWIANGEQLPESSNVQVIYDEASALADVASKRAILDLLPQMLRHEEIVGTTGCAIEWWECREVVGAPNPPERPGCDCRAADAERVLRLLAQPFAEHPEYRPTWKP